jgi:hypothetical protein
MCNGITIEDCPCQNCAELKIATGYPYHNRFGMYSE